MAPDGDEFPETASIDPVVMLREVFGDITIVKEARHHPTTSDCEELAIGTGGSTIRQVRSAPNCAAADAPPACTNQDGLPRCDPCMS